MAVAARCFDLKPCHGSATANALTSLFELIMLAAILDLEGPSMKTSGDVQGSKPRRGRTKVRARAPIIGTRPLQVSMHLRGQLVDVKVVPAVSTTTHVNYQITISCGGKVLDWVPNRAELEQIGRAVAKQTDIQNSH